MKKHEEISLRVGDKIRHKNVQKSKFTVVFNHAGIYVLQHTNVSETPCLIVTEQQILAHYELFKDNCECPHPIITEENFPEHYGKSVVAWDSNERPLCSDTGTLVGYDRESQYPFIVRLSHATRITVHYKHIAFI